MRKKMTTLLDVNQLKKKLIWIILGVFLAGGIGLGLRVLMDYTDTLTNGEVFFINFGHLLELKTWVIKLF